MNIPKTTQFTLKRIVENLGKIPNKGFSEETPKLTPEQKQQLVNMASMFESYGNILGKEQDIMESAKSMEEFCKLAESYAINECGDWFQQEIIRKDMKAMGGKVQEYKKAAQECYVRMQQLGVLYEDIRHIAGRYYDLKSLQETFAQSGETDVQNDIKVNYSEESPAGFSTETDAKSDSFEDELDQLLGTGQ